MKTTDHFKRTIETYLAERACVRTTFLRYHLRVPIKI